ncbi:hypothetical protein HAHE_20230 [Haloferula helveola]|uniref:PEP-CTERM protein-sorting domain-containing protein n=1 Tax=Haloferula helveola TaxID=490095 RepID=A0ABN6H3B1_9BACT|nr:hypothetical protein HAHE_20230 [Haloferula helveola]
MRFPSSLLAVTAIVFGSSLTTEAATILNGAPSYTTNATMAADLEYGPGGPDIFLAATVTTSGGTLRSIEFTGQDSSDAFLPDFAIAILLPNGPAGGPGSLVAESETTLYNRTRINPTVRRFTYQVDLDTEIVLADGTYFLAIVNVEPGSDFVMEMLNTGSGQAHQSTTDLTSGYGSGVGRMMRLSGADTRYDPVPEPSAFVLAAFGGVLLLRRRRA